MDTKVHLLYRQVNILDNNIMVYLLYRHVNIMDDMVQKLEKYGTNLEFLVQQRTIELVEEKKKTDSLLGRMLPM